MLAMATASLPSLIYANRVFFCKCCLCVHAVQWALLVIWISLALLLKRFKDTVLLFFVITQCCVLCAEKKSGIIKGWGSGLGTHLQEESHLDSFFQNKAQLNWPEGNYWNENYFNCSLSCKRKKGGEKGEGKSFKIKWILG